VECEAIFHRVKFNPAIAGLLLEILQVFLWLFPPLAGSPSSDLNKIEHFSKASDGGRFYSCNNKIIPFPQNV